MEEQVIWRSVEGYEGLYEVSNTGFVRSVRRATTRGRILKGVPDKNGYLHVSLSAGNVRRRFSIHRLVAKAFVPGQTELKNTVNHKNEVKNDNRAENLEWCTSGYNTRYMGGIERRAKKRRIPVIAYSENEIKVFDSIVKAAKELGVSHGDISGCLRKYRGRKSLKGYRFERG